MQDLVYELAGNEQELQGAYEVRRQVFVLEQGIPEKLVYSGEGGDNTLNMVVKDKEMVIGTARVKLLAHNQAKIERMAVLKTCRQKGVGKGIIDFLNNELKTRQTKCAFLHAQHAVVRFYRSCGFREAGLQFYEAGIKHVKMEIRY